MNTVRLERKFFYPSTPICLVPFQLRGIRRQIRAIRGCITNSGFEETG